MSTAAENQRKIVVERVLHGAGVTSGDDRRAAFENRPPQSAAGAAELLAVVAKNAWKVTDEHVAAAKRTGISEDAIYELVICAAVGQASRQLDSALAALDAAEKELAK